jgi:GAF domain-containing protein
MADVPDQLARSLAILAEPEVATWTTRKKLLRAVQLARVTIGRCDAAGVALIGRLGLDGEVCTSAAAYRLDEAQREAGGGPCFDALTSLQIFNVESIANACAWPEFRQAAAEHGMRSSLSIPLTIWGVALGRLNLYSKSVNGFEGCERQGATFAAGLAAAVAPPEGRTARSA